MVVDPGGARVPRGAARTGGDHLWRTLRGSSHGGRGATDAPAPACGADSGSLHTPALHCPPTAVRSLLPSGEAPLLEIALPGKPRQRGRRRDCGVDPAPALVEFDGERVGARWRARPD